VMPLAVTCLAAFRAMAPPKESVLDLPLDHALWMLFKISLPSAKVRPRVSIATSSRSIRATSWTRSWPEAFTTTS
jgi:hypothetical protein